MGNLHILYVEDDIVDQKCFTRIMKRLTKVKYTTTTCIAKAKELIEKTPNFFNLLISDRVLEDGTGLDLLPFAQQYNIPMILVSGSTHPKTLRDAFEGGLKAHMLKPIQINALIQLIYTHTGVQLQIQSLPKKTKVPKKSRSFVNLTPLKQLSNNDQAFIAEIIQLYLQQSPSFIRNMQQYVQQQNWTQLQKTAHRFKSSLQAIGATDMKVLATNIEMCTNCAANKCKLEKTIHQLNVFNNIALRELKRYLQQHNTL